ncbi:MAG: hypothetical protein KDD41_03785 [Flavobacteriales bacterium]|nr:hypothetical protein [Flavobacteriales bacterium]
MEHQKCMECGERIVGRSDKKFCSDYCRNTFNNKIHREGKKLIRATNARLQKNWRILEELNPEASTQILKDDLLDLGFDFNLCTSIYWTKEGKPICFCYNQGFLKLDEHVYSIIKKN